MLSLRYAYNTNGCAHHRLDDALSLMADCGYDGVALTLDWHHFDPFAADWQQRAEQLRRRLEALGLGCVIETGARYLLNPRRKHDPILLSPEPESRARRVAFLCRALDIQVALGAETMSCWAGVAAPELARDAGMTLLQEGLKQVLDYAQEVGGEVSLEPEPGMFIETNADYLVLRQQLGERGQALRLALDLGHVWVTGEEQAHEGRRTAAFAALPAPAKAVHSLADRLGTVAIEGMDRGVHVHRPLDEGDMPIEPLLRALRDVRFERLVTVELSRESHRAHLAIPQSINLLRRLERSSSPH